MVNIFLVFIIVELAGGLLLSLLEFFPFVEAWGDPLLPREQHSPANSTMMEAKKQR